MRNLLFTGLLIASVLILSCTGEGSGRKGITKEFINPASGYSQVVSVTSGGVKTLYVSGQIGKGEDLEAQMRSALSNLKSQLTAAGATFDDIVKMNTYIVDYGPEQLSIFRGVRKEIMGDEDMPASTLVGVQSLAREEWLIEMEAIAIVEVE